MITRVRRTVGPLPQGTPGSTRTLARIPAPGGSGRDQELPKPRGPRVRTGAPQTVGDRGRGRGSGSRTLGEGSSAPPHLPTLGDNPPRSFPPPPLNHGGGGGAVTHSCRESDPDVPAARAAASLPFLAKNVRPRADPGPPPLILGKRGKGAGGLGLDWESVPGALRDLERGGGFVLYGGTHCQFHSRPRPPPNPSLPHPEEKALRQQRGGWLSLRGTVAAAGIPVLRRFPAPWPSSFLLCPARRRSGRA